MEILLVSLRFASVGAYAQTLSKVRDPGSSEVGITLGTLNIGLVNMYCVLPNISCLAESGSKSQQPPHQPCVTSARVDSLAGFAYFFDLAASLAIERVNNDPSILPGIQVGLRRFSNCGNEWSKQLEVSYIGDSAGYAGSEMVREILEDPAGVVGTVGVEFSRTVTVAAEVLSYYQIPHCSGTSGSPRFSNKYKYPYFWRMFANSDFSGHVHLLLPHWRVRRIAMIRERNDELGFNVGADVLTTFRAKGIQISAKIDISGKLNEDDAVYAKNLIVNTETHYVFISGQADFTASALYRLGKLNITGSDFVFIGITAPSPYGNPVKVFGPDFYNFVQGYVMLAAVPDATNPQYKQFNELLHLRTKVNLWSNGSLLSPDVDIVSSYGVDAAYDCTMLMLLGIEQLMKNNPEVNLSMVSKRVLNEHMNATNFQNLDYTGVLGEPRRLDSKGDVKMPFHFLRYINASVVLIGTSDSNAGRFEPFQNYTGTGFSSLPPDGFTNEFIFAKDWQSTLGQIIIALTCLGCAFCVVSLVFISRFRKNKILRSAAIPELVTIVVGCTLGYASLIFYILPQTPYLCTAQLSLIGLGFSVVISTIICKNLMVAKLFAGFHIKFPQEVTRMHRAVNCGIIFMGIVAVIIILHLRGPPLVVEKHSINGDYFICIENTQKGPWFLAYIFTFYYGLLFSGLFVALYKSQRILWDCSNESGAIALIILVCTISYAIQSMLSIHVDELTDFRKCICVWIQTSVVLFSVIGSKVWTVFKYEMQRSKVRSLISQLMTRLANREEQAIKSLARLGEDRSRSFGISGGAISRRSGGSLTGKKKMGVNSFIDRKGVLMYAVLSKTVSKCVYKYQREKSSKSTWCCGECQLFSVCDRIWFLFQSEEITDPFRILDSLEITDCGNGCLMIQQDAMYTIWLEFESLEIVAQFLLELQSALADLKTAQCKFVRQDSVNVIKSAEI